jgi:hypothetical protein
VRVGLLEGRPGEAGGDHAGEVGAAEDVLVPAGQGVGDGGARRLGLDDPFVELGKLALGELPPGVEAIGPGGEERLQLAQREADAVRPDGWPGGSWPTAAPTGSATSG